MSERDIKRILVGPLPVPSQVGDAAIAVGAVLLLRRAFPHARISGSTSRIDTANEAAVRSFRETYDVDAVIPNPEIPSGTEELLPAKVIRALREMGLAAKKNALPTAGRLFGARTVALPLGNMAPIVREIAQADLVVMRGGGYLRSPHIACDLLAFSDALNEIAIARALGTPYAIWGHTIWGLDGPLSKRILWPLIADSRITVCREQRSYEYLVEQGAPAEKLVVLPDTAFALEPISQEAAADILRNEGIPEGSPVVGVNVRPPWDVDADYEELTNRYLGAVAAMIDWMVSQHTADIVLISHCHSTDLYAVAPFQDERELRLRVVDRVQAKEHVHLLSGEYSPAERTGIYGCCQVVVTTRLHVGILSALGGTPSVNIAYEQTKARGIAQMMGLEDYVLDIREITDDSLIEVVERLWANRQQCRAGLKSRVHDIKAELPQYVELTLS